MAAGVRSLIVAPRPITHVESGTQYPMCLFSVVVSVIWDILAQDVQGDRDVRKSRELSTSLKRCAYLSVIDHLPGCTGR